MDRYFAVNPSDNPFVAYGPAHLVALLSAVGVSAGLLAFRGASRRMRDRVLWVLVVALITNEIAWNIWESVNGLWTLQTALPLQMCYLLTWLSPVLALTRNQLLYECHFFYGIVGAAGAMVTPTLDGYGFPHFLFISFFISHGLLVAIPIYVTFVEGMRPTLASIGRVLLVGVALMAVMFGVNVLLGSNYMYLNGRPPNPSILDFLPPWPAYVPLMIPIAGALFLVLYAMYRVADWLLAKAFPLNRGSS